AAYPQPPDHDDPVPLVQGLGSVLGEVTPAVDVEEGRLLLLLAVLAGPATVGGDTQGGDGCAATGEAEIGVIGEVPDEGDEVGFEGHCQLLTASSPHASGARWVRAARGRARRCGRTRVRRPCGPGCPGARS